LKISTGELAVGAQLPSVRGLAHQLLINPNTVSKAYAELVAGGWLVSRAGLGLYVAEGREHLNASERDRRLDVAVERFVHEVVALRYDPDAAANRVAHALSALMLRKSA
jgi:GntR family transcriptional regulator